MAKTNTQQEHEPFAPLPPEPPEYYAPPPPESYAPPESQTEQSPQKQPLVTPGKIFSTNLPSGDVIIGNVDFNDIPDKNYISTDHETARKYAERLAQSGIAFSSVLKADNAATVTVSKSDRAAVLSAIAEPVQAQQTAQTPQTQQPAPPESQILQQPLKTPPPTEKLPTAKVDKIAEAAVVSEKIKAQAQAKLLNDREIRKTAEEIKASLPEPPRNIIFKMLRGSLENKIEKVGERADNHKAKIADFKEKSGVIQGKIDTAQSKIARYQRSNDFLCKLKVPRFLKGALIDSNHRKIARLEKQIGGHEKKQAAIQAKIENTQSKLSKCEDKLNGFTGKIRKIDELKNEPHAVLSYYLSELSEANERREAVRAEREQAREAKEAAKAERPQARENPEVQAGEIDIEKVAFEVEGEKIEFEIDKEEVGNRDERNELRDFGDFDDFDDFDSDPYVYNEQEEAYGL